MTLYRRRPARSTPDYVPRPARRPLTRAGGRPRKPEAPEATGPKPQTSLLNHGAPDGYRQSKPSTTTRKGRTDGARLYAVVGAWHEGDVIGDCVRNLLANGVEKVFLVDNDSPDDTVAQAVSAGAVHARSFKTEYYDDDVRLRLMNEVMKEVTEGEKAEDLWWLSLDADEFPCGPGGSPVLDFVRSLPKDVNAVGCNSFDLYPEGPVFFEAGRHPADSMTRGVVRREYRNIYCGRSHWKHPLLRQRRGVYGLAQSRGSHVPYTKAEAAVEPEEELILFHAPFRSPEAARRRLEALCGADPALGGLSRMASDDKVTTDNGAGKRWRSLDAVYAGRWHEVEVPHSQGYGGNLVGVALYPWKRVLGFSNLTRWYPWKAEAPTPTAGLTILQPTGSSCGG